MKKPTHKRLSISLICVATCLLTGFTGVEDKSPGDISLLDITGSHVHAQSGGSDAEKDAAFFLMAASFGPTRASIDELVSKGFSDWIAEQLAMPIQSSILQNTFAELTDRRQLNSPAIAREAWFESAILGRDQLRQRVAFALSQLLVVSSEGVTRGGSELGALSRIAAGRHVQRNDGPVPDLSR